MRSCLRFFFVPALLSLSAAAWAGGSVSADYATGTGYTGYDGSARLDLPEHPDTSLIASYSYVHETQGTETRSNQASLGFDHAADKAWSFRGTLTGWYDSISGIIYSGPSWGFTWEPPGAPFGVLFDNDLFLYRAPELATPRYVKVRGHFVLVPPAPGTINVMQWHPTFQIEKQLYGGMVVPSLEAGHYFYSRDPFVIEQRAGLPRFTGSAGALNSLAGGFFNNDATAAVSVSLPRHTLLKTYIGVEQSATDFTWAVTGGVSAKTDITQSVAILGKWDRTTQYGLTTDIFTVGATVYF